MTSTEDRTARGRAGLRAATLAGVAYLVLAVALWWGVWTSHPSATTTCGCGDGARFLWFFGWPPFALAHGHGLFWSAWLFHPSGINLLDDTSVLALSVLLAPFTALAGPVLALNIGLTLAPALSAMAMWVLLRRWVHWPGAAFVGGLLYGFSPFMVTELALSQLNIAFLVVPPLIALVLEDLLSSQRRRPLVAGTMLAALLVVQFFVSTEVLLISVLAAAVAALALLAGAARLAPPAIRARLPHSVAGAAAALVLAGVVLAYPVWFLLHGPAHFSGPVWANGGTAQFGTTIASLWSTAGLGPLQAGMARFGGYQGPELAGLGYLGLGVVALSVFGAVWFRRDRRLLLLAVVGGIFFVLSLAPGHGVVVPWQAVDHIPLVGDIVEGRFALVVTLCAAAVVALTVDHVHQRLAGAQSGEPMDGPGLRPSAVPRPVAGLSRLAPYLLCAVALVPTVVVLWPNLPLTVRPVVLPEWFATEGRSLPPGRVVLVYPVPFSGLQASQAWQAENRMRWAQAGGGGPTGQAGRAAAGARAGFSVLAAASLPLGPAPGTTGDNLEAVRRALAVWGVTTVVVPRGTDLPVYERGRPDAWSVSFLTAVLGEPPVFEHDAWVWDAVATASSPVAVSSRQFARCVSAAVADHAPGAGPSCVLQSRPSRSGVAPAGTSADASSVGSVSR